MQNAAGSLATAAEWADAALLERDAELALLADALNGAREGRGSTVVLHGGPGIGKTRLLEAARRLASEQPTEVLSARGRELETDFGFGVCLQLFESRLARAETGEREHLLAGAAGLAAPLFEAGPRQAPPEDPASSLFHGLYWLCANLAESRPLLLLVDDAHLADESSMRFMLYLAQRVDQLPVTVVLATHTVSSYRAQHPLAALTGHSAVATAELQPLSEERVAELLRGGLFPRARGRFCRACFEATGGNPLLLRELADELAAQGVDSSGRGARKVPRIAPRPIGDRVLIRLRSMGAGAAELALAVAVAGDEAELRYAAKLADLKRADAGRVADELAAAGILQGNERLSFAHPIVRRALYEQLPPAERAEAHLKLASVLAAEDASEEVIASHLMRARRGEQTWVVETLTVAAARAMVRGAPDGAVRYLRRALEEPPSQQWRSHVTLELGRAEAVAGEPEAVERLRAAIELIADPRQRALTSLEIGRALHAQGRHGDAVEAFRRGAAEAEEIDRDLRLQLHTAYTLVGRMIGISADDLERTAPTPRIKEEKPAATTPAGRVLLGHMAFEEALRGGSRDHVLSLARAALARGDLLKDETSDGLGPYFVASALIIAEDLQAAELALVTALEDARSRGSVLGFATASYFRAWAILRRGRLNDAAADAQAALELEPLGWRMGLPGAHALLASAHLERDDAEAARRELALGRLAAARTSETPLPFYSAGQAWLQLRDGQPERALTSFLQVGERLESSGTVNPACVPWRSGAAKACARLGDREEALQFIDQELKLARAFGAPGAIGHSLLTKAALLNGEGIDLLREAVELLEGSQAALDRARAMVALGTALRHAGKRREAREPLREGLDLAQRCGAKTLVKQARSEAVAAGAKPRRTALSGIESLTTREREVAELAAEGRSNREIAEGLFVTIKTVEWHLRHTYEKLGVSSRQELAKSFGSGAEAR